MATQNTAFKTGNAVLYSVFGVPVAKSSEVTNEHENRSNGDNDRHISRSLNIWDFLWQGIILQIVNSNAEYKQADRTC